MKHAKTKNQVPVEVCHKNVNFPDYLSVCVLTMKIHISILKSRYHHQIHHHNAPFHYFYGNNTLKQCNHTRLKMASISLNFYNICITYYNSYSNTHITSFFMRLKYVESIK